MKNRPREVVNFKSKFFFFHFQKEVDKLRCMFWNFKSTYVDEVIYVVLPLYLEGGVYNFSGNFRSGKGLLLFPLCMKQPENPENVIPQEVHPGFCTESEILFRLEISIA